MSLPKFLKELQHVLRNTSLIVDSAALILQQCGCFAGIAITELYICGPYTVQRCCAGLWGIASRLGILTSRTENPTDSGWSTNIILLSLSQENLFSDRVRFSLHTCTCNYDTAHAKHMGHALRVLPVPGVTPDPEGPILCTSMPYQCQLVSFISTYFCMAGENSSSQAHHRILPALTSSLGHLASEASMLSAVVTHGVSIIAMR